MKNKFEEKFHKPFNRVEIENILIDKYKHIIYSKIEETTLSGQLIPETYTVYIGEDWGLHKFEQSGENIDDALSNMILTNDVLIKLMEEKYVH